MTATGIGAPVRRKEDQRFVTGKGRYIDDFNRPGQAYAHFLRSPHAHAAHPQRRHGAGAGDARHGRRADRRRPRGRQDRRPDLRLDDPLQGRLAHEGRAASGARPGQGALCRRPCRGGDRRDAGAGEGRGGSDRRRLRGAAGGRRHRGGAGRGRRDPRGRAGQHRLPLASRRQGRRRPGLRAGQARHARSISSTTASSQRHRAARGDRRVR